jgi:hypothetical protein
MGGLVVTIVASLSSSISSSTKGWMPSAARCSGLAWSVGWSSSAG